MPEIKVYGATSALPSPIQVGDIERLLKKEYELLKENSNMTFEDVLEKLPEHKLYKGNSACIEIEYDMSPVMICDAGSGLNALGKDILKRNLERKEIFIFISHTHLDHVQGFPFFEPLLHEDYQVNVMGSFSGLQTRFETLMHSNYHSFTMQDVKAKLNFIELEVGRNYKLDNVKVKALKLDEHGSSYAYKFDNGMKRILYTTDVNYSYFNDKELAKQYLGDCDAILFDSMFSFTEALEKMDVGHSSALVGVDLAVEYGLKKIIFFDHNPNYSVEKIVACYQEAKNYLLKTYPDSSLEMLLAYDGLELRA